MIITKPVKPLKNSAVFLDRDGIINKEVKYCHRIEDFSFIPNVIDVIHALQLSFEHIFIVTNQAGISRGYYTEQQYYELTDWMLKQFIRENISISKVYHCPHHPSGLPPYNIECNCRKPRPGMLLAAISEYNIDPEKSILLGDKISDIEAAKDANIAFSFLLGTGHHVSADDAVKSDGYFSTMEEFLLYINQNPLFSPVQMTE